MFKCKFRALLDVHQLISKPIWKYFVLCDSALSYVIQHYQMQVCFDGQVVLKQDETQF